jgi:hypothetical protein
LPCCALMCLLLAALQEYLNDYGTEEEKAIGRQVLEREANIGLSDSAKVTNYDAHMRSSKRVLARVPESRPG